MEDQLKLSRFIKDVQKINGKEDLDFSEIVVYTKNDATKEVAQKYLNALEQMITTIDGTILSSSDKFAYKYGFTQLMISKCESECKSIIINKLGLSSKKYKIMLDQMHSDFQKERDDHNELCRRYNEKQKEVHVEIPSIDLSLTLKNPKTLSNQECLKFLDDLDLDNRELSDNFKRISVSNDFPNVSRAYAKKGKGSENVIIQKTKT